MKDDDLDLIRKKIDMIDWEIVQLLNRRMEIAARSRNLKQKVLDPERESQVLNNVKSFSHNLIEPEFSEEIYKHILKESKKLQQQNYKLVGFQGEHGAYSEVASLAFNPALKPIPCREFYEVFHGVETGQFDIGVVPVENSLEGLITQVNDLLTETKLKVIGEVKIPIHHCLLALPEAEYRDLKIVYSHPQALAQCREYIERHRLEARPFYDTAGSAKMLSEDRPEATAVIASRLCADLYHLEVIQEDIEDHESNATRFVVLSKKEAEGQGDKCSIIFSVAHQAGALYAILKIFSDNGINLTRIESRPARSDPGNYVFFTDIEGSDKDGKVVNVLKAVQKSARSYKFLGCYQSYKG